MKKIIFKNIQLNLFITLGVGILNFAVNRYFAEYMGIETLGLMKLFTQMIAYLSLVDLGISSASAYALYKPLAEKDTKKINTVVSTIESFYGKIAIGILILGVLISFFLKFFIEENNYGNLLYLYWILYVVNTSIGYLFAKYSILFTANQEYGYVRKIQGLGKIIFQCIQIISLIKIGSFSLFIVIMILENLYNYCFYRNHYNKNYNYIEKTGDRDRNIVKNMKNLFWHKIAGLVVFNTDYIVLAKFINLAVVGVYSSYLIIYQMIITIINILTPVLTPKIGEFIARNSKEKIYIFWRELYSIYIMFSTILIVCAFYLIEPFVKLWLGESFILPQITITLILINLFIHLIRGVTDTFKDCCGFFDDVYSPALEASLNLFFSLMLVKSFGLNGVIIGTLISNVVVIFLLKPILVFKRCFGKKGISYINDSMKLLFLFGLSFGLIDLSVKKIIKLDLKNIISWTEFLYKSGIIGVISIVTTIVVFLFNRDIKLLIMKAKK